MGSERQYLYDQKGPWPQPNPLDARLFPAILHLPRKEKRQWNFRVGLRYVAQALFYTPIAAFYALRRPWIEILDDAGFEERFDNTVFNKMIVPFSLPKAPAKPGEPAEPGEPDSRPPGGGTPSPDYDDEGNVAAQAPVKKSAKLMLEQRERFAQQMALEAFPEFIQQAQVAQFDPIQQAPIPGPKPPEPDSSAPPEPDSSEPPADPVADPPAEAPAEEPPSASAPGSEGEVRYFIADFSIFEDLPTYEGTYIAGTKALFKRTRPGEKLDVVSIRVNGVNFTPADGDAWDLAKLFTMQAASIRLVFSTHALLHFPADSINAITKNELPTDHVLYQLLIPHTDLQLVLDNVVQTGLSSPLLNRQIFPWCAHTGPGAGNVTSLVRVYGGVEGNPAYPRYSYKHPRRTPEEKYVNFVEAYYQTILEFVTKVLACVPDGDPDVIEWANHIAAHVPGFPDGDHIFEVGDNGLRNLDWAAATFIWDVSVGHTTDHYNMGELDINENPMRVRVPPPTSKTSTYEPKKLRSWADMFRYRLFWRMFLTSFTVYRLDRVRYPFTDSKLCALNDEFLANLQKTAAEQAAKGEEYIPLREIARSVQF